MRIATLLTVPLLAALIGQPTAVSAQSISIQFGTRLGPEIGVFDYSPERLGDWRNNYRQWTPVTLYDVNGHYYRAQVRNARPVLVYMYNNQYFFPPRDRGWHGVDNRYNYNRRPNDSDYGRARQYTPDAAWFDARLGPEVGVLAYSPRRGGDWRRNVRRWTPVTLYQVRGRYFLNNSAGARPVSVYRYRDEYFLPPNDRGWVGSDRRFDYNNQPNDDDRGRVRDRP